MLILGLLFLRFPLLIWACMTHQNMMSWAFSVFDIGTYFLTALLIWWERDRLAEFHIDGLALGLLLVKPLNALFYVPLGNFFYLLYIPIGIGLAVALFRCCPEVYRPNKKSWTWLAVGILTGIALGITAGYIFSHFQNNGIGWVERKPLSVIFTNPVLAIEYFSKMFLGSIFQTFYAGAAEEPLFRGFLWGALRRLGWRNRWICVFQAGLFCLGHIFYIPAKLYWSLAFTFITGLAFGVLAYRSRSIATSMAAHGFNNGCGDVFVNMVPWK